VNFDNDIPKEFQVQSARLTELYFREITEIGLFAAM
jgi:hypothetical protein